MPIEIPFCLIHKWQAKLYNDKIINSITYRHELLPVKNYAIANAVNLYDKRYKPFP